MSADLKTICYLMPGEDSFWKWSDDSNVVTWLDDGTIAFNQELRSYLSRFVGRGLPPIECFLLVLAATRASWPSRATQLLATLDGSPRQQDTVSLLGQVHIAAQGRCNSVEERAALLFLLLDRVKSVVNSDTAAAVIDLITQGMNEAIRLQLGQLTISPESGHQALVRALRALHPILQDFSADKLQLRQETGLDELPHAPGDLQLSESQNARAFLKSLQDEDSDLSSLASLATKLMSVVSLPRHLGVRDERPIGGISDISNRGSLDRLLISELAHDDLTLAVRVATNEAMYLRRESPPISPPKQRTILLDTGLRTWGIPRIYIAATGLAFLATSDQRSETSVRSLTQNRSIEVDLATRAGLTEQLSTRSPHLFPDDAWHEELQRWESAGGECAAPVFVTTPETTQDKQFLLNIRPFLSQGLLVVTVDRNGKFELTEWSIQGCKPLRSAQFQLDEVLPEQNDLLDDEAQRWLPAIFRTRKFPLLLGPQVNADASWFLRGVGGFQITRDGRLMFAESNKRGSQQLHASIGSLEWAARESIDGSVYAVARSSSDDARFQLIAINALTREPTVTEFQLPGARAFFDHNKELFAVTDKVAVRLSLKTAEQRQTLKVPDGTYLQKGVNSRFFYRFEKAKLAWFCLASRGDQLTLEKVTPKGNAGIKVLFEMPHFEGIMAVDSTGGIIDIDTGNVWFTTEEARELGSFQQVSRSGRFLVYGSHNRLVEPLPHMKTTRTIRTGKLPLDPGVAKVFRSLSLRVNLSAVGFCPGVGLVLRSKGQKLVAIHLVNEQLRITARTDHVRVVRMTEFRRVEGEFRSQLWVANFENGGQVFLDRRGLLHLKSTDTRIPEVSLVLNDSNVAGWLSSGEVFGREFFHRPAKRVISASDVLHRAIRPFIRHCQEVQIEL